MNIVRSDQEIWDLLNQCADAEETGGSNYPGMTYEQGIKAVSYTHLTLPTRRLV